MLNFIERLRRASVQDANEAAELLASCNLPDPADLRHQLAAFESQRDGDDAAWERLDRTSNPRAFMEQQAIAERRERLLLQIDALKSQIAAAEKRRAAFVALVEILDATDQQIEAAARRLYADVLIVSKDERRARLEALDGLVRVRARLAAPLAVVSSLRKFRRTPDPFAALAHDLRERAEEIDRTLGPGMRRGIAAMPDGAPELIATLNGGTA